jgi:methanogenic corrinoid protein MtbC1
MGGLSVNVPTRISFRSAPTRPTVDESYEWIEIPQGEDVFFDSEKTRMYLAYRNDGMGIRGQVFRGRHVAMAFFRRLKTHVEQEWFRKEMTGAFTHIPNHSILNLIEAITDIGDRFGTGELWLPELVLGAKTMNAAMPILQDEIRRRGMETRSLGKVVLGTVLGDVHSIGLDMVCTLLIASGFEVVNLGVNVSGDRFIEAVQTERPDILGMSALLTTTAPEQEKVIRYVKRAGLRDSVKIMVGGGAVTQEFADAIGADGYAPTAPLAVRLAKRLVGSENGG